MTQINVSTKQKQTLRHREETCGCQGAGRIEEGRNGNLVLSESSYYIQDDKTTKSYCIAQGTIFNIS